MKGRRFRHLLDMLALRERHTSQWGNAMEKFLAKHANDVTGSLSGFDRVVFRGMLRQLAYPFGMSSDS